MSGTYKLGNSVRVRATFYDVDGALMDPAVVLLLVKEPPASTGTETTYTYPADDIVRVSAGVYQFWIATDAAGTWAYRWKGDDVVDVANEDTFDVEESAFTTP